MLGDHEGLFYQLHLLNSFLLVGQRQQAMGRVHRAVLQLIGPGGRSRKTRNRLASNNLPLENLAGSGWQMTSRTIAGEPIQGSCSLCKVHGAGWWSCKLHWIHIPQRSPKGTPKRSN